MHRLSRLVATVALLGATAAFATGEKIVLVPEANNQLHDTLCISMDCVSGRGDVTVSTHVVKGGVEVTVTAGGQRKLTQFAPAGADGQLSSTDLVRVTSAVLKAIESPTALAEAPKAEPAKAPHAKVAKPHLKLVARR